MIEWRDKMSVDDGGVIDQDHRHLIEIINQFEALSKDGLDRDEACQILYSLKFYTQTHFSREETLQGLISYPYAEAHHKEHQHLIKKLQDVIDHLGTMNVDVKKQIHQEIADMLHDWLINHILHSDLQMRQYFEHFKNDAPELGALKDMEMPVH